ncbi:MAG TPA: hypothetical protein VF320_10060, partial [Acidimicrobiales bacterium]
MAAVINPTSLSDVARLSRPLTLARDRLVPVLPALAGLVPEGGLQQGSTVAVEGDAATSLGLALAAGPSLAGAWVVVVGRADLGLAAAAEAGVALDRLALVAPPPPEHWAGVVAALIGSVGVVLVDPDHRVRAADARRLAARARERGTLLIQMARGQGARGQGARGPARPGLEVDLRLQVVESAWQGLGSGHGNLQARRVTVESGGRRHAARPRRVELWLPDE